MHVRDRLDAALVRAIDRACAADMVWGEDDCALWCAGVLKDVFGYDAGGEFRGRYRTKIGSRRVMGKTGLLGALRHAARRHGWKRIDPRLAQVGDIGFAAGSYSCVICRAPRKFVGRNTRGLTVLPVPDEIERSPIRFAWKVARHKRPAKIERPIAQAPSIRRGSLSMAPTYEAPRDPVSIALSISALLGGTAVSVGAVAAGLNAVIGVGLAIGLNYAASALLQRGNQPLSGQAGINDPSVRYNTRQPIPPKRIIYGTAQVGGALFFEQVDKPYLTQGVLLCSKPIKGIRKIWLGTNELQFASMAPNSILSPLAVVDQPNFADNLQASIRLGLADQAVDPIIASNFPGIQGTLIGQDVGTIIGDMTSTVGASYGIDKAFDGNKDAPYISSALKETAALGPYTAFIGKDYGTGNAKSLGGFRVSAPNNLGLGNGADDLIRVTLQGSNDGVTWAPVYTVDLKKYAIGEKLARAFAASAAYSQWSVLFEKPAAVAITQFYVAEVEFFEANGFEFRQRGIATAVLRYNFGADQTEYTELWGQTQRPNPIFLADGIGVPDPRRSGCIVEYDPKDPDAVAEAEATWPLGLNNAALCQAHYLTQRYGGRIDPRRMNWDKVARAADWDDSVIATKSGNLIKRGTIDGLITLNQKPSDVISSMLSANRGFVLESAGRVWVSSSPPQEPIATIHDGILSGAIEYQAAKPKRDYINRLKVRFVAPGREFQTVDGPVLKRADYLAVDGELLDGVLDLAFTLDDSEDAVRPQVLQKAFIETSRLGKRITCVTDVILLAEADDDLVGAVVNFSSVLFPQLNGRYFIEKWGFTDNFGAIQLSLIQYDASIETNFNAAVDQQDFTLPPVDVAA